MPEQYSDHLADDQVNNIRTVVLSVRLGTSANSAFTNNNGVVTVQFQSGPTPGIGRISAEADTAGTHIDIPVDHWLFMPITRR